ncbi:drug/metabolite transporter (DMT)-like permease [Anaerosolibacter carboniphilus]|uniref:Drug/metabolite transporter (DMT)-like permease n=1 Tax=Anaerosolibacter carboniphilus TaxID=1417629 RepID=A0A841L5M6_9FIRM|nr:EamA family transporter [Anaerosolibacter carboniphilus]MBB6218412.1 drug/metabolite transporter (DMT)-like permease [Anaerosolibacter carboniphilus]
MKRIAYFSVMCAAILWGILGIFIKKLYGFGFNPFQIVAIRAVGAFAMLFLYVTATDRKLLRIQLKDVIYFIGTGIISFVFFNWCYFMAIHYTTLSIASILLYTAPAFVIVFSTLLFKERLTSRKILSFVLTFAGCILVTGFFQQTGNSLPMIGILAGLGAGLGYALYSIFGRYALKKYDSMTVTLYTFLFASLGLIPITDFQGMYPLFSGVDVLFYSICLSLFSTVLPFIFYTKGLNQLETSRASIIATLEPAVATMVSIVVFQEHITSSRMMGIVLVLAAIIVVNENVSVEEKEHIPLNE